MKTWEFLISVGEYKQASKQRNGWHMTCNMGQAMFNVAATTWKGLGEKIMIHDADVDEIDRIDPFYRDEVIPAFLEFLKREGYLED